MSSPIAHIPAPSERQSHGARRSSLANPRTASRAAAPSTSPMQTQLEKKSRTPDPPTPSATATYAVKTTSSTAHAIRMAAPTGIPLVQALPPAGEGNERKVRRQARERFRGRLCESAIAERDGRARSSGFLCGVEDLVRGQRLLRGHASEAVAERPLPLGEEGRPHLQDRVGEAELPDPAGGAGERGLAADLDVLPELAAVADGEALDDLGARGRELDAAVHAEGAEAPRVHLARRDPLGGEREREAGVGVDRGVVPRVAGDGLAVRAGALADDVLEHGVEALGSPTEPQREVQDVHAEVVHHTRAAAELGLALPVDRLGAVEVAGVQERVLGLDQLSQRAAADRVVREQGAREVGHLARAADEDVARLDRLDDAAAGGEVDAERLLAQEVLAGRDRVEVELLVQVVRDREVEDVEVGVVQQMAVIVGRDAQGADAVKPGARVVARVADRLQPRRDRVVLQRR